MANEIGDGTHSPYTSGHGGDGGNITITGGSVKAVVGEDARGAGIGGAYYGGAGTIVISGGLVYADGYRDDIGPGFGSTSGSFTISGDAAIFLRGNSCMTPLLPNAHVNKLQAEYTANSEYGVSVPDSSWLNSEGAYFRLCTLAYDANEGEGTVPDSMTRHYKTTTQVNDGSGLTKANFTFSGWNTQSGGGTSYGPNATLSFLSNVTLYAQWTSAVTAVPETGQNITYLYLFAGLGILSLVALTLLTAKRRRKIFR